MRILLVNGSPRRAAANSRIFLDSLRARLGEGHDYRLVETMAGEAAIEDLDADFLVLAFPLYNNCLHSRLLAWLLSYETLLQSARASGKTRGKVGMIAVANSGCPDGGVQNRIALEIVADFCERTGVEWRGGLGVGSGEMTGLLKRAPEGMPLKRPVSRALDEIASRVVNGAAPPGEIFAAYLFPWPLFRFAAHAEWKRRARANGLGPRELRARPFASR